MRNDKDENSRRNRINAGIQRLLPLKFTMENFSFEDFILCPGNTEAFRLMKRISENLQAFPLIYVYGPGGVGKTHLVEALRAKLKISEKSSVPKISLDRTRPVQNSEEGAPDWDEVPALIIENIDRIDESRSLKTSLWDLMNAFFNQNKPVIVTSRVKPELIPALDDHLRSRMRWGVIAEITCLDNDAKKEIIKKMARDHGFKLKEPAIKYLSLHAPRDLNFMRRILSALQRKSLKEGRRISRNLIKEVLDSLET